jgi:integrase
MPEIQLKGVNIIGRPGGARKSDYRRYERLIYNIKKVYPYAKVVRLRLERVNEELKNIPDEKDRKNYIKSIEKDVFAEYEDDIRQMTITQGRLLIKLIDRETQNTSYDLIREYRGKIAAGFWQGIARIFGTNLKEHYDADGEDLLIELIINEIDLGRI